MELKLSTLRSILSLTLFGMLVTFCTQAQSKAKAEEKNNSLKEYSGQYIYDNQSDFGFDITITYNKDNVAEAEPTDKSQPKAEMLALGEDSFELQNTGGIAITFSRNDKGEIESLTMSNGNKSFTCLKKKE